MLPAHQLLLIGLVSVGIGTIVMFIYTYAPLRVVSKTIFAAIFRMRLKYKIKGLAKRNAQYTRSERSVAAFEPVGTTIMKSNLDGRTLRAMRDLVDMVQKDYRPYIQRIYLFGSRARGDFRKFSDMDVALFFLPTFKVNVFMLPKLISISFKILMAHGIYAQIRILQKGSGMNSYLRAVIEEEGVLLHRGNVTR